jgi:hypothetical protein
MSSAFDGNSQVTLMTGASAGLAAGANFAVFGDETAQIFRLFIVNGRVAVGTKLTKAWTDEEPSSTALRGLLGHDLLSS